MNSTELITSLTAAAQQLNADTLSQVDFAELQTSLHAAVAYIESLEERVQLADRLLSLLKAELTRRARAVARAQGRQRHIAEKLISSENLPFAELLELRQQLDEEFDQVFFQRLMEPTGAAAKGEKRVDSEVKPQVKS